jgi:Domain of unknown function (DUF4337)
MASAHEAHEKIHEAGHGHHADPFNKRVAILIAVLAAMLALTETGGKSAQNAYIAANIEAANLWAFFQAKTIRMTVTRVAAETLEAQPRGTPEQWAPMEKKIAKFTEAASRYDSEPETQEGRKELAQRAKAAEQKRDDALGTYHHFEYASAAFQLAIVLASAAVVTGVGALAFGAGAIGLMGTALGALGWLAPHLFHL